MIGRILLGFAALAVACFVLLALIGLWDRYSQETEALGFNGIYERYLASRAGFPDDLKAYRAAAEAERAWQGDGRETAAIFLRLLRWLVKWADVLITQIQARHRGMVRGVPF